MTPNDKDGPYGDGNWTIKRLRCPGMDPRHTYNLDGNCVRNHCPACWERKVKEAADLQEAVEVELAHRRALKEKT